MSLNSTIINTLAPTNVPVAFQVYRGSATTYIRFFEIVDVPALYAENKVTDSEKSIQVDIFSKGNYEALAIQTKALMEKAGFTWSGTRPSYEEDTEYFHLALTYRKPIKLEN